MGLDSSLSYASRASDLADIAREKVDLLVVGGGYIGAELAQLFARAGVKVTLVFRSRLLPEAEPEISRALTGYFEDEGINVVSGVVIGAFAIVAIASVLAPVAPAT